MHKANAARSVEAAALVGRAIGTPSTKAVSLSANLEVGRAGPFKICLFNLNTVH